MFLGKGVLKICSKFTGEHLCRNHNLAWVFSCKFAAYFQNTLSYEHVWVAASDILIFNVPGTLFRNIPRNFIGNFFRIVWEYIMGMFHEYSTNILANICWSSRLLQHVLGVTIFRLPRRLYDVLSRRFQDIFKTSWKTKNWYAKDVLKTSWR